MIKVVVSKKVMAVLAVFLLITLIHPAIVGRNICSKKVTEKISNVGIDVISFNAENADLFYSDNGHFGRLWLPNHVVHINIYGGNTKLRINGKTQEMELPVYIMLRRFFGFGPMVHNNKFEQNISVNFYGICGEIVVIPYDVLFDYVYEQYVFKVDDVKDFGQAVFGLTSADFNDDDYVDFAVSSATHPFSSSTISIFYNKGGLGFLQEDVYLFNYTYISDLDSADFDNDGDVDLMFTYSEYVWDQDIAVNVNGTVNLLFNDGNNCFGNCTMVAWHGPGIPYDHENRINPQLTSADFDMDGDVDFLVGDNSGKVELYSNTGSGNFTNVGIIHDFGFCSWGLTSKDYDGDGDIDFMVASGISPVYYDGHVYMKKNMMVESNYSTCFEPGTGEILLNISSSTGSGSLLALDYENDGDFDIVTCMMDVLFFYLYEQGEYDIYNLGKFPLDKVGITDDLSLGVLTSSDYNNDGKMDFILGGMHGIVRLCRNNYGQLPPLIPWIMEPPGVKPGKEAEFRFVTKDINKDEVFYYIDWGDGTDSGWIGPYASGEEVVLSHSWPKACTYHLKAKAKDDDGESKWKEYVLIIFRGGVSVMLETANTTENKKDFTYFNP